MPYLIYNKQQAICFKSTMDGGRLLLFIREPLDFQTLWISSKSLERQIRTGRLNLLSMSIPLIMMKALETLFIAGHGANLVVLRIQLCNDARGFTIGRQTYRRR